MVYKPAIETTNLLDSRHPHNQTYSCEETSIESANLKETDLLEHDIFNQKNLLRECLAVFKSSVPVILSYIIEFINPFITSYSVGWLGKEELASSALSAMFASITGWSFAAGMTSALDTLCSQAYTGSDDIKMVGVYAQRGFLVSMVLFLPISLTWFHAEPLLLLIGQDETLAELCGLYLRWLLLAVPPFIGFECIKKFLQAQGIMEASANILILNLPVCFALNYLLVWYPPTSLGFIGAPIASSITSWCYFISGILYVTFIDGNKAWGGFSKKAFTEWGVILRLGIPGVVMVCSEWWAYEIMAFSASYLGKASLAAHGAMSNLSGLLYQVAYGAGTVSSNRIGNFLGEGHPNKAKLASISCLIVGGIYGMVSCSMIFIFSPFLKSFNNDDPDVVHFASTILPVMALFQVGDVMAGVASGILRGMGRQDIGAQLNLLIFYCFAIPFGILLAFYIGLGVEGLWIGFATGSATIAMISIGLCLKVDWKIESDRAKTRIQQ